MDVGAVAFGCVMNSILGAIATQLQRRLWHRLEKARAQLTASDRMSVLGRMSAGIAHEMKTPLAAAMNGLESTRALAAELAESIDHPDVEPADLHEIAREIGVVVEGAASATRRAARFIAAIRSQTLQGSDAEYAPFAVKNVVDAAITLVEHARRQARIEVDTTRVAHDLVVEGDEGKLSQIVTNLICNAVDACADGRGTKVSIGAQRDGGSVLLVVEDDGPGVPIEHRTRIFDALFTTKRDAEGTGLGLAISRDLAEGSLGGTLVLAESARGARFELRFPGTTARPEPVRAWAPASAA
jgi:C4-dicarboxylate-specific signal transduction histidine kinase